LPPAIKKKDKGRPAILLCAQRGRFHRISIARRCGGLPVGRFWEKGKGGNYFAKRGGGKPKFSRKGNRYWKKRF